VGRAAHDLNTGSDASAMDAAGGVLVASTGAGIGVGSINPTTGEVAITERKPARPLVPTSRTTNPLPSPTAAAGAGSHHSNISVSSSSYYVYTSSSGGAVPASNATLVADADADGDSSQSHLRSSRSDATNANGGTAVSDTENDNAGASASATVTAAAPSSRWNGVPTTLRFRNPSQAHESWITAIAWLPLSNRVAISSMDRSIVFYDPSDLDVTKYEVAVSRIRNLPHTPLCLDATQTPDGKRELLAVGDDGGNLTIFNFTDRAWHICDGLGGLRCRHSQDASRASARSNSSNGNGSSGSSSSGSGSGTGSGGGAFQWCTGVSRSMASRLHSDWITSVKFDARLDCLITGSLDGRIQQVLVDKPLDSVRDPVKKKGMANEPLVFTEHHEGVYCFDYIPKSRWMASGGLERNILIWNAYTNDLVHTLVGHTAPVHYLTVDSALGLLITCDVQHTIKIWDLRNDLQCVQTIDAAQYAAPAPGGGASTSSSAERLSGGPGLSWSEC
jgi:WD40 repeat protein